MFRVRIISRNYTYERKNTRSHSCAPHYSRWRLVCAYTPRSCCASAGNNHRYAAARRFNNNDRDGSSDSRRDQSGNHNDQQWLFAKTVSVTEGTTITWENESSGPMWVGADVHPTHTEYDGTSKNTHCSASYTGPVPFDQCKSNANGGKHLQLHVHESGHMGIPQSLGKPDDGYGDCKTKSKHVRQRKRGTSKTMDDVRLARLAHRALRIGVAFAFLYPPIAALSDPEWWLAISRRSYVHFL